MTTLQTIQKTFHVFEVLTKIARILCIVGACVCGAGALCAVAVQNGVRIFSLFGEQVAVFPAGTDLKQLFANLLSATIMLTADAVLLVFTGRYFKVEQAEGTPFTANGAELLKKLGIRCIYVPIVAVAAVAVVGLCLTMPELDGGLIGNLPGLIVGLVLLLVSLIFRYGAELEEKSGEDEPAC